MEWNEYLMRVLSISKIGQRYSKDDYALENYRELEKISLTMLNNYTKPALTQNIFEREVYPTPNASVRCLILHDNRLLMVQEKDDLGWAVPGGWCEVFLSLSLNAQKEVLEETGYQVKPGRLLAVFQREKYKNYPTLVSEYCFYLTAEIIGGKPNGNHEVLGVDFFPLNQLPELSRKNTTSELLTALTILEQDLPVYFD